MLPPNRDAYVPEDAMPFLDQGVVDRHPGIVDHPVLHAERVGLRYPAVIVDRTRPVAALRCIDLVYRDDLARLRLGQQIVIVESPPCRGVAAKGAARKSRVAARARPDVEDAHFEHVTWLGMADEDRPRADMNA